jgi:hypothetical protein
VVLTIKELKSLACLPADNFKLAGELNDEIILKSGSYDIDYKAIKI